jgi:aspartate aminotransferase-like enzyme
MDVTIRWGATRTQPILMTPGPTELPFPVVAAMNQPAAIQGVAAAQAVFAGPPA